MSEWISVKKKLPKDGEIIWAHFGTGEWIRTEMAMYTPSYIVSLCREDERQWKGLGFEDIDNWTHWMHIKPARPPKPPKK